MRDGSTGIMEIGLWRILRNGGFHALAMQIMRPLLAQRCEFIAGGSLQSECEQKGEANHAGRILLFLRDGYDYYSTSFLGLPCCALYVAGRPMLT